MKGFSHIMAVSALAASACGAFTHECTEIGCGDGASLTLRPAAGAWADGAYTFTVTVEGTEHVCSFSFSDGNPAQTGRHPLPCEPPLGGPGAVLVQDAECREERAAGSVRQTCTPIPDRYSLQLGVTKTPPSLGIQLARDGAPLIQQSVDLTYTAFRPNGPDCETECQQASETLTFD